MLLDYWKVSISEYQSAWKATGELMFQNFEQCQFKLVLSDIDSYCSGTTPVDAQKKKSKYELEPESSVEQPNCARGRIMQNVKANLFSLVTEMSSLAETFKEDDWALQPIEERA